MTAGELILEGKQKRVLKGRLPGTVVFKIKDELTGGDAAKRESISEIAVSKVTQTENVFKLLESKSVPTAFLDRVADRDLLCWDCDMLPLELVTRRFAWGSFQFRNPQIKNGTRFESVRTEFFHKKALILPPLVEVAQLIGESEARKKYLKGGVWEADVYPDPYIQLGAKWGIAPAKKPVPDQFPLCIDPLLSPSEVSDVEAVMKKAFEVLEQAWKGVVTEQGPVTLCDMKIEMGRRKKDGKLVIADVVDNDCWRIWPGGDPKNQLDKQCFFFQHWTFQEQKSLFAFPNQYMI